MTDANILDRAVSKAPLKYRTVDADQHLNPPQTFWVDYLPQHLKALAPRIEHGDDADDLVGGTDIGVGRRMVRHAEDAEQFHAAGNADQRLHHASQSQGSDSIRCDRVKKKTNLGASTLHALQLGRVWPMRHI